MQNVNTNYYPSCDLSHDLINKLSAIMGYCELLTGEEDERERQRKLRLMMNLAATMAEQLKSHVCRLKALAKPPQSESFVRTQSQHHRKS